MHTTTKKGYLCIQVYIFRRSSFLASLSSSSSPPSHLSRKPLARDFHSSIHAELITSCDLSEMQVRNGKFERKKENILPYVLGKVIFGGVVCVVVVHIALPADVK